MLNLFVHHVTSRIEKVKSMLCLVRAYLYVPSQHVPSLQPSVGRDHVGSTASAVTWFITGHNKIILRYGITILFRLYRNGDSQINNIYFYTPQLRVSATWK